MPDFILTERRADGVELVRFNRPPHNALSAELLTELADVVDGLGRDPDLKVVVLAGSDRTFAAGAEISQVLDPAGPLIPAFRRAFDGLAGLRRPVIAAVTGFALGGGLEAALACDLRLATESARLGVPEVALGLFPGAGGTQRLARLVGPARAKELIWTGRHVRAAEALALGLVDRVVPADGYLEAALGWASELASGAVVAMGLAKQAVDGGLGLPLVEGLDLERALFAEVIRTEDAATGVQSFFDHGPGRATFAGR